jgi:aspartate ammonia-lyase
VSRRGCVALAAHTVASYPAPVNALAEIKAAAARANGGLGLIDETKVRLIVDACNEIIGGRLHDQFAVDVIHGGAGTSTNMNANEVIANLANSPARVVWEEDSGDQSTMNHWIIVNLLLCLSGGLL